MPIPAALERDLRALTDALDGPDADLSGSIAALASSARRAVGSYLGLSVLITVGPDDVALTLYDDNPSQARTSIYLASPAGEPAAERIVTGVVLYARVPGAFVDLAADAGWLDATRVVRVDEHLPARADSSASTYLLDQSTVDQAIGVLLARGATLDGARVALAERARAGRTTRAEVARRILAELDEGPPLRS